MTGWELIGRFYGERLARKPRLRRALARLIEVSEVLWKWGWRVFFGLMALFIFFSVIGDILIYLTPSSSYGYAFKYRVDTSNVVINPLPHDCEWGSAPLGDKHCHYEAEVSCVLTVTSKNGTPLVSYDEGRTWHINTDHLKPSVSVSWIKVDE